MPQAYRDRCWFWSKKKTPLRGLVLVPPKADIDLFLCEHNQKKVKTGFFPPTKILETRTKRVSRKTCKTVVLSKKFMGTKLRQVGHQQWKMEEKGKWLTESKWLNEFTLTQHKGSIFGQEPHLEQRVVNNKCFYKNLRCRETDTTDAVMIWSKTKRQYGPYRNIGRKPIYLIECDTVTIRSIGLLAGLLHWTKGYMIPVSYTHLTLPTICSV